MSLKRPVFIGGCDRSGTTLLGSMIGNHPSCLCTPESQFKIDPMIPGDDIEKIDLQDAFRKIIENWRFQTWGISDDLPLEILEDVSSYPELLLKISEIYGNHVNKEEAKIWIDHTPSNLKHFSQLLLLFPDARFVHIVRDGRGVANSMQSVTWGPHTIPRLADYWASRVAPGLAAEIELSSDQIMRICYEDLVRCTETTMRKMSSFLDLSYKLEMSGEASFDPPDYTTDQHQLIGEPPEPSRAEAWKKELSDRQVEMFESKSGELLNLLGYDPRYGINAVSMTRLEHLRSDLKELVSRQVGRLRTWMNRHFG